MGHRRLHPAAVIALILVSTAACGGEDGAASRNCSSSRACAATTPQRVRSTPWAKCGAAGRVKETRVRLKVVGESLVVSWDAPPAPSQADESVGLIVTITPKLYDLSFSRVGPNSGAYRSLFQFVPTPVQRDLHTAFFNGRRRSSMSVPLALMPRIRRSSRWHASILIRGATIARCPYGESSMLLPAVLDCHPLRVGSDG